MGHVFHNQTWRHMVWKTNSAIREKKIEEKKKKKKNTPTVSTFMRLFDILPSFILHQDADCTKSMCSCGCPSPAQSFCHTARHTSLLGPHFHTVSGQGGASSGMGRSGQEAAEGQESWRSDLAHARGDQHQARVHPSRLHWEARWVAGSVSIHSRPLPYHVHLQALDDQTIRRLQHGGGEQQIL